MGRNPSDEELIEYDETLTKEPKKTERPVTTHTSFFKDFLLIDPLNKVLASINFEHPSEVQQQCIPRAILGADILCQAKSGSGKTAVFILSTLQQIQPIPKETSAIVIVHTHELAQQVYGEFLRFLKFFENVTVDCFHGGSDFRDDRLRLEIGQPNIFVGTPGRTLDLLTRRIVHFRHVKHFIIDEVDKCLEKDTMRFVIQRIFVKTPRNKQVMMFTATLNEDKKKLCLLFLNQPHEVYVGDESKLTLHGLKQLYLNVSEENKKQKLEQILDTRNYSQLVIFVEDKIKARNLNTYLKERGFPSIDIHSDIITEERKKRFLEFKSMKHRILITTDLMSRGIDIQDINIVINYDMPDCPETYLHRVGRAGRFETKGEAISFVSDSTDSVILNQVQSRFEVSISDYEVTGDKDMLVC
ncbi:DEAD/DEAH box helicase [Hamiltosporidium tvaerminnensis]|uniref:RNA helicase n=2 Tax=Hamiltosporidium TaxID=1176354 RepID=A0A4Q9LJG9_9MICR|nr:hypothetical protein LUQ84_002272 [Hamiltosporidium tvaerminnensis]TBU01237.1 DEAD/DEAH box helicase [Hamiltosporidium tvaerminnensis]TBU08358.1 DEAD/DEAH box helicase [Hamiltosporidium magnivora]